MSKIIKVTDLKPGMHLAKICGSWLDHPFWKNEFILTHEHIEQLKSSHIEEVMIDFEKSHLEDNHLPNPLKNEIHSTVSQIHIPSLPIPKPVIKTSLSVEIKKAKNVVKNASSKVQQLFHDARMGKAFNANEVEALVDEINDSISRNSDALISIVRLKNKDNYTYMHSVAVCALMISLSKTLGFDDEFRKKAGMAGLLHDVGKMFIPLEILNKPGKLTDEEFLVVKNHPMKGWDLLKTCSNISDETLDVCLHHHEKFDGSGYPSNLKENDISIISKMASVCDIYDAITSDRPYKKGWEPTVSIKNMSQWTGHFDPRIFRAFVSSLGIYPVGSIVKLNSGRIGIVIEKCESNLLTPKIKIFFSLKSNMRITPEILDLSKPYVKDKIESHESNMNFNLQDISELLVTEN